MKLDEAEVIDLFKENNPARPYLVAGAVACGYGIVKGGFPGFLCLAAGSLALLKGIDELDRIKTLHGGNAHGNNAPPKMEDVVSMR
jgi:hypothetical protein